MVTVKRRCLGAAGLAILLVAAGRAWGDATARQVIRADGDQASLLKEDAWQPFQRAFPFQRDGEAFVCDNGSNARALGGVSQTVILNQTSPQPIIA
jgi:hypothetical protein